MTFSQISYLRVDIAALSRQVEEITTRLNNACSEEEAAAYIKNCSLLLSDQLTMETVSYIRYTMNTEDPFYSAEQEYYAEETPALMEKLKSFQRAMLDSRFRPQLERIFAPVLFLNAEIADKTLSMEVLPLLTQENKLVLEYQALLGRMQAEMDGKLVPITRLAPFKLSRDRNVRQKAYTAEGRAFLEKQDKYDQIYGQMVKVRTDIAKKLGNETFVPLGYQRMTRNCYGPEDVAAFRRQVRDEVVPIVSRLKEKQRKLLGIDRICLFDDGVKTPLGNPMPVKTDKALYEEGVRMYREMTEETKTFITRMEENEAFDLLSRPGKMAGGYCTWLDRYKTPFIFANFNGTAADVDVFTHEGGHAFAYFLGNQTAELPDLVSPTLEGCEIHSMSMEFLCWPWLERYYGEQAERARVIHLLDALEFLPYGCMVDEFQHEVYERPDMNYEERCRVWQRLEHEYRPYLAMDGIPFFENGHGWQRQLHIYCDPFYYIDYCIAQTCALEVLSWILQDGWQKAWEKYSAYVHLGGKAPLLTLLEDAGFSNPFAPGVLKRLAENALKYVEEHEDFLK